MKPLHSPKLTLRAVGAGLCLPLLLGACGGGSSDATTTLSGVAMAGPFISGTVCAYKVSNAALSSQLGCSAIDTATSGYSINFSGYTGDVVVAMEGSPAYDDEATVGDETTGTPMLGTLRSIVNVSGGGAVQVALTPLTEAAIRTAASLSRTAITTAATQLSQAFGMGSGFDMFSTLPQRVPTAGNQAAYRQALAALSRMQQAAGVQYNANLGSYLDYFASNASSLQSTITTAVAANLPSNCSFTNATLACSVASGSTGGGGGGGTSSGSVSAPLVSTADGHYMLSYSSGPTIGIDLRAPHTLRLTMDSSTGGLLGYDTNSAAAANSRENIQIGSNSTAELGGNANITWGRWNGGATTGNYNGNSGIPGTIGATQGFHYVIGTAANPPTTGTVSYTVLGATQPTVGSGGVGSFSGTIKVDYAADKVGVDLTVTMPDHTYHVVSNGGLTTLSTSELSIDRTYLTANGGALGGDMVVGHIAMPVGGTACTAANCSFMFDGMVVGASGSNLVGGTYMIFTSSPRAGSVHGAAVFTPQP